MTLFLRLIDLDNKERSLNDEIARLRRLGQSAVAYRVRSEEFLRIPGAPFAYWVSDRVRQLFTSKSANNYVFKPGIASGDDFRFLRSWWEPSNKSGHISIAKGGDFSPFYQDLDLVFRTGADGREFLSFEKCQPRNMSFFGRPGITWPFRTARGLNTRILPRESAFTIQGMAGFEEKNDSEEILFLLGVTNSIAFKQLLLLSVGAFAFQAGAMTLVPIPVVENGTRKAVSSLALKLWREKREIDSMIETSHAFAVPCAATTLSMESRLARLTALRQELDHLIFQIYDFHEHDRSAIEKLAKEFEGVVETDEGDCNDDDVVDTDPHNIEEGGAGDWHGFSSLSWAVGVGFGRFDLRLVTGEREAPPEPDPFDPLPAKSPGMLPDGAAPFHAHNGILVDDQGHKHDLPRLIEEVLARVQAEVPGDVRRWLQRDFFPLHLKQYSKSRRKAPIYWPLSTASGAYTLWLYYPSLTDQTLHAAVNDFIEPKLQQVAREAAALRDKGAARTRDDDKALGAFQDLERELNELREALLRIAPSWKPNHDDGVQITAAPLWELFRHRPWQTVLKDTWAKLNKGDYDWAHLAMAYWPARVREKCKTDKSLAIAHDLEALYVAPEPKTGGRKKKGAEA